MSKLHAVPLARRLLSHLAGLDLPAGAHLPEDRLGRALGLSRTPIRPRFAAALGGRGGARRAASRLLPGGALPGHLPGRRRHAGGERRHAARADRRRPAARRPRRGAWRGGPRRALRDQPTDRRAGSAGARRGRLVEPANGLALQPGPPHAGGDRGQLPLPAGHRAGGPPAADLPPLRGEIDRCREDHLRLLSLPPRERTPRAAFRVDAGFHDLLARFGNNAFFASAVASRTGCVS